jgi:hypothetical protein
MTLDELILYYDGVGYRASRIVAHRGSHGDGYINTKTHGPKYGYQGYEEYKDSLADDWVGKPNGNKLLALIHK